jgi:ankyrin repeat protein
MNSQQVSSLVDFASKGNLEKVCAALQGTGTNINIVDGATGETALTAASVQGHLEIVSELLKDRNLNVNLKNGSGNTSLIVATEKGLPDIVLELLKHGSIDVNIRNAMNQTALLIASEQGNVGIVRIFVEARWGAH